MDPNLKAILDSDLKFETLIPDLTRTTNKEKCSQAESLFNLCKQRDPVKIVRTLASFRCACHVSNSVAKHIGSKTVRNPSACMDLAAKEAFVLLIELARTKWTFFTKGGWPMFLNIVEAERFEEKMRLSVIEVLITAVEEDKCKREDQKLFFNRLFAILMKMLLSDIEDEDAGRPSNYIFRKQCLHTLATALRGNTILPVVYLYLSALNHEWQKHLAGLVALAQIAERLSKLVTIQNLRQLVTRVLNSIKSHPDHPRVRLAAINVTAQLFADLDADLESEYHRHVLPALVKAMCEDRDSRVRLAAINVTAQLFADLDPDFESEYYRRVLPALDKAIRVDTDSSVRLAAINVTAQLVKAMLVDPDSRVRLDAINVTAQLSADLNPDLKFEYHRRVLPALGDAMCEDPDSHVRLAVIDVTAQLSADLDPDLQFEYHGLLLPSLAGAMGEDPDSHVRLAAINVIVQLFANLDQEELSLTEEYHLSVLYALHGAICEFEDLLVQERAVDAMISISINYLPNLISSILVVTVATLREFRRREDIASDQTRIIAIRNTLIKLESLRF